MKKIVLILAILVVFSGWRIWRVKKGGGVRTRTQLLLITIMSLGVALFFIAFIAAMVFSALGDIVKAGISGGISGCGGGISLGIRECLYRRYIEGKEAQ